MPVRPAPRHARRRLPDEARRQRAEWIREDRLQTHRPCLRAHRGPRGRRGIRPGVEEALERGRDAAAAVRRLQHPRGAPRRHAAGRDLRPHQDGGGPVRDEGRAALPGRAPGTDPRSNGGVGMPGKDEVPSTVERSDDKAERTWVKTYDSAMDSYDDDGARARRTAFAALKHTHEKVGDHWEPKDSYGPSDEQAAHRGVDSDRPTAGGV